MTTRQFEESSIEAAYVSLILSLLVVLCAQLFNLVADSPLFHRHARRFLSDYGMPISVIAVSACAYWGRFQTSDPSKLPVGNSFEAAGGRPWLVSFWKMEGDPKWIAIAIPFGFVRTTSRRVWGFNSTIFRFFLFYLRSTTKSQ